CKQETNWIFTF
nr:immunoglobulin light chain junction region [Macaca mulatta]